MARLQTARQCPPPGARKGWLIIGTGSLDQDGDPSPDQESLAAWNIAVP